MSSVIVEYPVASLTFGDLTWVEDGAYPPDASGVRYIVQAEDATLGTAIPVTVALLWLGRAGGPEAYDHTDNREPVFRIKVQADDSNLLALGELALQKQCERPTELTWTPPDGAGEPSVFDVVWSHLEPVFDPGYEIHNRARVYVVRMKALPHAREATTVVTPALPVTPTYTLIDNGSALSGTGFAWSVVTSPGLSVSIDTGRVKMLRTSVLLANNSLVRTGLLPNTPYLAVDYSLSGATLSSLRMDVTAAGGAPTTTTAPLVTLIDLGGGVTRGFFSLPFNAVNYVQLKVSTNLGTNPVAFYVDQVQAVDAIPFIGTARQKALSLTPGGSVQTQGSIQVSHATNALGKTIVYTHPAGTGYLPPLSPWRFSGDTRTSDSSTLSGARCTLTGPTDFRVPVYALPRGRVELWAWLRSNAATEFRLHWTIDSIMNLTVVNPIVATSVLLTLPANTWTLVCIAADTMPPADIGPAGFVRVALQRDGADTETVDLDEAYLFATDEGRLTVIDCGSGSAVAGGPSNRLWIDAPSLDQPMGSIWRGNATDRSDAWHAGYLAESWPPDGHGLDHAGVSIFVATQNTIDADTSSEHYRRYNTFVARET